MKSQLSGRPTKSSARIQPITSLRVTPYGSSTPSSSSLSLSLSSSTSVGAFFAASTSAT
uniref:Uncharacterized protein n=1 Tax=Arundo donax TaxID=35708 RepID=A0A0A8YHY7_ARUDO